MQKQAPSIVVSTSAPKRGADGALPIIVHSHLRWDFVWQRPQQILGRLAANHRIAFIEEPLFHDDETSLAITEVEAGVVRIVPMLRHGEAADVDLQCARILPHLQRAFREHPLLAGRFERVVQWFYSPTVAPAFLNKFEVAAVVYDCMDELSKFRYAPADLTQREGVLLANADLVFTGGYQLYLRKSKHHGNVHFYGCGVDADHYAKARDRTTQVPADVADLAGPVLGYFGVIDERLDYELIDALAVAFDRGSVVMIGPVAKVDPASLPRRSNLHWLGQRAYEDLPAYVKAFDACLMPFALNEATENINPTKTLEYMAAGKPVISTAIADVVRQFAAIVQVGRSRDEFVRMAAEACHSPDKAAIAAGIDRARNASWDSMVDEMRAHMLSAVRTRHAARPQRLTA